MCLNAQMSFSVMLMFVFFSFSIFASLEPISDSAHILSVIDDAMDKLDALKNENFIDADGRDIKLDHYDTEFKNVSFGYDTRRTLKEVSFKIPERTSTAIVGPSGSGKTTVCSLLARFYDPQSGSITVGGHNLKEFTCDSLLSNISMVFQNVYRFNDTVRSNICFGKPDTTEEEMIEAAKKARCHDFITALPEGYDTVVGEGGGTLSGGEKQRISIARTILKNAPIVILDEATASIDPENEHLIQQAISELTQGKTIITIITELRSDDIYDAVFVAVRYTQIETVIETFRIDKTENIIFVGNNVCASMTAALLPGKNVMFAFLSSAGHRETDRVVSVDLHKAVIGGINGGQPGKELIGQIFDSTGYKVTYEPCMEDYLLCHAAFVIPAVFACYKTDGKLKEIKNDKAYLNRMIDANIKGYRIIRSAGHKILPGSDENFESEKYRKTCFLFFRPMCATSLEKICASDHAMNAAEEMSALNRYMKKFFDKNNGKYPVWRELERESGEYLK